MQAKDVMTHPVISVSSRSSILEAVRLMLQHKISGLPVLDESGSLAGIVSEGDFFRGSHRAADRAAGSNGCRSGQAGR